MSGLEPPVSIRSDAPTEAETRFLKLVGRLSIDVPFDVYAISVAPACGRGGGSGRLLADNLPEDYRRRYLEHRDFERDPVMLASRAGRLPVRTAEVRAVAEADPELMPCFAAAVAALGPAVLAIPLRFRNRLSGDVVFRRRGAEFSDAEVGYCELAAPALLLAATELPVAGPPDDLTPRERECLAWTSVGKTAWEIGSILGISEHTAVAHLNGAVRKLRAVSRAQAVAEALRRGLID
ncbi:Transcriptional activator protein luxR [Blastochloris viridis]|uniref:Transcriptional activator protein luxR n=1 Tax=Blastochloris viridis TaxID=1079 RepID=A0A0S4Q6V7_BLAVI|nr:Transcriptional activator protein luxR [Blastochloris viridis]